MIRALIFDCFGVLYKDPGKLFYEKHVPQFDELREAIQQVDNQFDHGYIDEAGHAAQVAEITGLDAMFIQDNVRKQHSRNDDLIDYMRELRSEYKIGMLSNIGRGGMASFFSEKEQTELFDEVVLSSDVGIIKPDPAIFEMTALRLGFEPAECVMIDDRASNCEGAEAAGMKAILYTTNRQLKSDLKALLDA